MSTKDKHVVIIGAGPGGLSCAMILANRGYRVSVFEREDAVGGRSRSLQVGNYLFDLGPTFLMMEFFLREIFLASGRKIENYLEMIKLEPMYKLSFVNGALFPTTDHEDMKAQLARMFPGSEGGLDQFLLKEKKRYDMMYPCLKKDYSTALTLLHPDLLKALPYLSLTKSLFQNLGRYFASEDCRIAFTFQAKYLGMSPWECPAAFTIIPYIEHAFGVYHTTGGLSRISDAMAKVVAEHGGTIHLSAKVEKIITDHARRARGVQLENGERIDADAVVINADFGHAMSTLFEPGFLKKYSPGKLTKRKYSCSTFMLYLGVDKQYNEPHHNIIFAKNYKQNITEIARGTRVSDDMSIYIRNAVINDKTLAPDGHSALYVLVPAPNTRSEIVWDDELIESYREKVLRRIEQRTSMSDLRQHITEEKIITPLQWATEFNLYNGSTFNLAHNLTQMLYFRPRNRFEECKNCYLTGGGTHPGSGLPTIYESARITADLVTTDIR